MAMSLVTMTFNLKLTVTERAVLQVFCDCSEDIPDHPGMGINCYPSLPRVAWQADVSRRTVAYVVRKLEEIKALVAKGVHPQLATTEYEINLTVIPKKSAFRPKRGRGGGRKLPTK
jgi:hypothetical protein